jgi:aspartyl protease family protein
MSSAITTALTLTGVTILGGLAAVELLQRNVQSARPAMNQAAAPQAALRPDSAAPASRQEILVAEANHYYADIRVDGRTIRAMIDTGASLVALSYEDADRLNIFPRPGDRTASFNTANGVVKATLVTLREVRLGSLSVRDVEAAVMPRGAMKGTLLGMSFLGKLRDYDVQAGRMILRQ